MNDRQNEKLNMFQTVLKYCRNRADVYANISAFGRAVDELENCVSDIKLTVEKQAGVALKGTTAQKGDAEVILVQSCISMANALYVYAYERQKKELMQKMSVNKSTFYRSHSNEVLALARNIAQKAAEYAGELTEYGITDAGRQALDAALLGYESLIVSPRSVINERKQHTGNLVQLLAAADSVLYDKLDKLVACYKESNPEFYNGYKNARNINDSYVRHRSNGNVSVSQKE